MSNDNYYVVIVPHGDQAAQALNTARMAGHAHATRHHGATHHSAPRSAAKHTAGASKSAHAQVESSGAASKSTAPLSGGRVRSWSVVVGDQKYDVTDFGTKCGYKIEQGGTLVWTGVLSSRGHDTHSTTLPSDTLTEVLRLAYVGDQREAAKSGMARTEPPAPSSKAPKSETRKKPASKRKAPASTSADSAPAQTPTSTPSKRAGSTSAPAPSPKAKRAPKRPKESPKNGPPTQRAPVAPPAAPSVENNVVLAGLMRKLRKEDPATAEQSFAALKQIWLGGGREATVEWMKHHTFRNAVDAFSDWMEKHFEAAQAMLAKAPPSAKPESHSAPPSAPKSAAPKSHKAPPSAPKSAAPKSGRAVNKAPESAPSSAKVA